MSEIQLLSPATISHVSIVISIISAAVVVVIFVLNRKTARIQHTLAFIKDYNGNERVDEAHKFIRDIKNYSNEEMIKKYSEDKNRKDYLFLMNKFELLAIGLKQNFYDKKLIEKYFYYDLYQVLNASQQLIQHIRKEDNDKDAFIEFETLATKTNFTYKTRNR